MKLSVYIITYNEEKRLQATLQAVQKIADDLVIVDSYSHDKTIAIAQHFGARIFKRKWTTYADQKNFAQNQCLFDWVLSLDADEVLSPELIKELSDLKKTDPKHMAYRLKIADMFPGMPFKKMTRTYRLIRLYHRKYATMPDHLMTMDRIALLKKTTVGDLYSPVLHYSFLNISHQVEKLNRYTDEVQFAIRYKERTYSFMRLFFEFPRQFFNYYLIRRYCLHGIFGFIAAMNLAYARFLKIAKSIEREKQNEH